MPNAKGQIEPGERLSPKTEFQKGQIPWSKGKTFTKEHKKKLSESHKGQIPGNFKPENEVGKTALHDWVKRKLGKPNLCEHCGITTGIFDWANISRKYYRDIEDWIRLCRKCHQKYDNVTQKAWATRRAKN